MFQQLSERQISRPFEADDLLAAALALTPGQHPFRATFIFEIDHQRAFFPFLRLPTMQLQRHEPFTANARS